MRTAKTRIIKPNLNFYDPTAFFLQYKCTGPLRHAALTDNTDYRLSETRIISVYDKLYVE